MLKSIEIRTVKDARGGEVQMMLRSGQFIVLAADGLLKALVVVLLSVACAFLFMVEFEALKRLEIHSKLVFWFLLNWNKDIENEFQSFLFLFIYKYIYLLFFFYEFWKLKMRSVFVWDHEFLCDEDIRAAR